MISNRRAFVRAAMALLVVLGWAGSRADAQLHGIDVSSYQGNVNWTAVRDAGNSFAFTKATEGTTYTNPYFRSSWAGIHSVGMVRGAYHYGHPGSDPVAQAKYFVNAVRAAGGYTGSSSLQLVLDIETTDGITSSSQLWSWVQSFMAEIHALTGRPGIIYTSPYFWEHTLGNPTNNLNCPLWIANYGVSSPAVPPAWSTWSFWQYTSTGSCPGVAGYCDLNYFHGTSTSLHNLCFP